MLNVKIAIQQLSLVICELFEKFNVLNSELRDTLLLACWTFVRLFSSMSSFMMFLLLNSQGDKIGRNGCTMFTGSSSTSWMCIVSESSVCVFVHNGFTWVHVEKQIKGEKKVFQITFMLHLREICIMEFFFRALSTCSIVWNVTCRHFVCCLSCSFVSEILKFTWNIKDLECARVVKIIQFHPLAKLDLLSA